MSRKKLNIYFDGRCFICAKEIDIYRKRNTDGNLQFVDISHPDFSANEHGVDPVAVHKEFHVKDEAGNVSTGVDAFIDIWEVLPGWGWAAKAASFWPVKVPMKLGYIIFAAVRPYLPRRSKTCSDGVCFR